MVPPYLGFYTILPSPILYGVWHKGGGRYIAQWSCNRIATGWALQIGGEGGIDSHNKAFK